MEVLEKPYYECLLTAAAMHGATHQREATVLSELCERLDIADIEIDECMYHSRRNS